MTQNFAPMVLSEDMVNKEGFESVYAVRGHTPLHAIIFPVATWWDLTALQYHGQEIFPTNLVPACRPRLLTTGPNIISIIRPNGFVDSTSAKEIF